eukprot:scaffold20392_cov14-Tisochrysis_lutea.AAC.1
MPTSRCCCCLVPLLQPLSMYVACKRRAETRAGAGGVIREEKDSWDGGAPCAAVGSDGAPAGPNLASCERQKRSRAYFGGTAAHWCSKVVRALMTPWNLVAFKKHVQVCAVGASSSQVRWNTYFQTTGSWGLARCK